jgi:dienelactone hydrolase
MTEIYRSSAISCRSTHVTYDVLVISVVFQIQPNLDAPGFLGGRAVAGGYSSLDIRCERQFPFPQDQVIGLLPIAREFAKAYRRVVIYGFSLGGYIALNFAPLLGASIAIALSPLFSPDPAKVPFERRWKRERNAVQTFPWDNMVPALKALDHAYLMYDPHDVDDQHIRSIVDAAPGATLMPVPYAGHPVASVLNADGLIYRVIADIAHDRLDLSAFRAAARLSCRASPRYYENLARFQPECRDALRVRLLERGLMLQKSARPPHLTALIPPLLRLGRWQEAADIGARACAAGADPREIALMLGSGPGAAGEGAES